MVGENRARLIQYLQELAPFEVRTELEFFLDGIDREEAEGYDLADAFTDWMDQVDGDPSRREELWECRKILIQVGFYLPMEEEEAKKLRVSCGRPWAFILQGIKYKVPMSWYRWLEV